MTSGPDRKIILEDGQEYYGYSFGSDREKILEIVFNTSMAGYQEILSDPSYTDQAVVMTYPIIGSYGMADDDYETDRISIGAMIVREYNGMPSNFRSTSTLGDIMQKNDVCGISGLDTRKLCRSIRDLGSRRVLITDSDTTVYAGLEKIRKSVMPKDAVSRVSCDKIWTAGDESGRFHVVAIDCGMKKNIVRSLIKKGCRVTVVPWNTTAATIIALDPDGIFISNGPGDPTDVPETVETMKELIGRFPVFGICLGHQIISLSCGAKTYKLKFGHRGGNHPVKDLKTGRIEITSQNHSYAVDEDSLRSTSLVVTHRNLLDDTVEGVRSEDGLAFSVQYHPESAPGPQDSAHLFDRFISIMEGYRSHA